MKKLKKLPKPDFTVILLLLGIIFIFFSAIATAQDTTQTERNQENVSKTSGSKFLLTGYGFTGFEMEQEGDETKSNFGETGFNPIFLWKPSDKLFFESELELELSDDAGFEFELEYVNVNLILNKYMTLRAGKFLSPFGTFQERLHPAWINKLRSKPLGFGHEGVGPGSEIGVELRGGFPLGSSKLNYSLYLSNGPTLNTGDENAMMAGMLEFENMSDNNLNKAIGGRIGFLPFSNSSLEIGFSGQSAVVGEADKMINGMIDTMLDDVNALMYAVDFSYVKSIKPLKSIIDIKGQLNNVTVDKTEFKNQMDTTGMMTYTFDNISQAYFIQFAYRPAMVKNKFFQNIEIVGRYSALTLPEKALWGEEKAQVIVGLNYWFTWRSALKINYQITTPDEGDPVTKYQIQWAIGF